MKGACASRSSCAGPVLSMKDRSAASPRSRSICTRHLYKSLAANCQATSPSMAKICYQLFQNARASLERDALYWHFPCYLQGYRGMQEESHRRGWRATPCSVIRAGDWKLIRDYETNTDSLYKPFRRHQRSPRPGPVQHRQARRTRRTPRRLARRNRCPDPQRTQPGLPQRVTQAPTRTRHTRSDLPTAARAAQ